MPMPIAAGHRRPCHIVMNDGREYHGEYIQFWRPVEGYLQFFWSVEYLYFHKMKSAFMEDVLLDGTMIDLRLLARNDGWDETQFTKKKPTSP